MGRSPSAIETVDSPAVRSFRVFFYYVFPPRTGSPQRSLANCWVLVHNHKRVPVSPRTPLRNLRLVFHFRQSLSNSLFFRACISVLRWPDKFHSLGQIFFSRFSSGAGRQGPSTVNDHWAYKCYGRRFLRLCWQRSATLVLSLVVHESVYFLTEFLPTLFLRQSRYYVLGQYWTQVFKTFYSSELEPTQPLETGKMSSPSLFPVSVSFLLIFPVIPRVLLNSRFPSNIKRNRRHLVHPMVSTQIWPVRVPNLIIAIFRIIAEHDFLITKNAYTISRRRSVTLINFVRNFDTFQNGKFALHFETI